MKGCGHIPQRKDPVQTFAKVQGRAEYFHVGPGKVPVLPKFFLKQKPSLSYDPNEGPTVECRPLKHPGKDSDLL